jgi:hypothetical protein
MVEISANAILLFTAMTDFLRISVVYLKQCVLKAVAKAGIGDDSVKMSEAALVTAAEEFKSSLIVAGSIRILAMGQLQQGEALLERLSKMDFKQTQIVVREKRLHGTAEWILDDLKFKLWLNGELPKLWCPGRGNNSFKYFMIRG